MSELTQTGERDVIVDEQPRCWRCDKKLAESVARPWKIRCRRCQAMNAQPA